jgi:MYXO-CTERM domain-containing protein
MKKNRGIGMAVSAAVLLLLFIAAAAMVPTASANPGWDYYRVIDIHNDKVSGSQDLLSFPVLIDHTADWLKYDDASGHVRRADGYDIVFTNADNSILLDFEIEKYDGTAGTLVAWVRIPTLKYNANTAIRLWYGNSAASDWSNPTGVWDTNYKMVQHLQETDIDGGAGDIKDATNNGIDGTTSGMDSNDQVAGQIDGSFAFDGTDDYVDYGDINIIDGETAVTFSAWVKTNTNGNLAIISKAVTDDRSFFFILNAGTSYPKLALKVWDGSANNYVDIRTNNDVVPLDTWVHVVEYIDLTTHANSYIYVNGVSKAHTITTSGTPPTSIANTASAMEIGRLWDGVFAFNGAIDEVRISASARSADWIKTGYNNQNSPGTFYEVKDRTDTGGSDPVPELPTAILFAVGLVVLVGYAGLRRRRRER